MRPPLGPLWYVALALIASLPLASAQDGNGPRAYRVGELSFLLPGSWRTQTVPESASPGILFTADGGQLGRMTVARLPAASGAVKPLDPKVDPMTAPETAEFRIALEESGLMPTSGAVNVSTEGDASVEAVAFRCKPASGDREIVVLTGTWRTGGQTLRARLQFPEGYANDAGSVLNAIRSSVRFRNASTLGFGGFRMAPGQPPAEWLRLAGTPAPPPPPLPAPPPPSIKTRLPR